MFILFIKKIQMQFFSEDFKDYLALIYPLIVCLLTKSSNLHIIILSLYVLLIFAGKRYRNYCNMAAALVILPILLLQNVEIAYTTIKQNTSSNMKEMEQKLAFNYQIWLTLIQGILIILLGKDSYNKYFVYKKQIYSILASQ